MERTLKYTLSLLSLMAMPVIGWSQAVIYETPLIHVQALEVPGEWDGPWDLNGEVKVTFTGTVLTPEFGGVGPQYISDGFITVDVKNLGPTDSKITEFFILRPTLSSGGSIGLGMGGALTSSTGANTRPDTWTMANSLSSQLVNTGGYGNPASDYFGMTTNVSTNPLTVPEILPDYPQSGKFVFFFQDLVGKFFDPDAWYHTPDKPLVFLRFLSVGNQSNDWNDSGKGFAGGPSFQPAIPEPGAIAGLAALGLGGILLIRRRRVKK